MFNNSEGVDCPVYDMHIVARPANLASPRLVGKTPVTIPRQVDAVTAPERNF